MLRIYRAECDALSIDRMCAYKDILLCLQSEERQLIFDVNTEKVVLSMDIPQYQDQSLDLEKNTSGYC